MRIDVRISDQHWEETRRYLLKNRDEQAVVLVCGEHRSRERHLLIVTEIVCLGPDAFEPGTSAELLRISPTTVARIAKRARERGLTLILCHSHPFQAHPEPSLIDLETEADLCGRVLVQRLGGRTVGSLIVGQDGVSGRGWNRAGSHPINQIAVVGDRTFVLGGVPVSVPSGTPTVDRQVRAWGRDGQSCLNDAHVAVVGVGGTGSHIASQLAYLRVGKLTLVDFDRVEESNLSRLVGAVPSDVGKPKVEVIRRSLIACSPDTEIVTVCDSVLDADPAPIVEADVIVAATDSHGSRALLTQMSYQFLVPLVDLGVEIQGSATRIRVGGGVRVCRPTSGCLHCAGTLEPALVREEYLSPCERMLEVGRGYIRNHHEPAPSVIALNGVVASLAVLEICHQLTGFLAGGVDRILYRGVERAVSAVTVSRRPDCPVCGEKGIVGLGNSVPLPLRAKAGRA